MKNFAGTLAGVVLLGGLAGYYFWVDVPKEEKQIRETQEAARVLPYLLDKVHRLAYKNGDITIEAVKENLTWKIKQPLEALGDHMLINGMLQQLEEARHTRVVEESPKDLEPFGLKSPAISITLEDKTFGKKTVHIGAPSPIGHSFYVQVDDNPRVVLLSGFQRDWNKTLFDFRSKTLLDFPSTDITEIEIDRPTNSLRIKKEDGQWQLLEPIKALGDNAAIENLMNQIRHARAQAFIDEAPTDLAPYGLDQPKHAARFKNPKQTWGLALGTVTDEGTLHAKLKNKQNVVAVEPKVQMAMETSYLDLIDKRVLTFEEKEIVRIEIRGSEPAITLVRGEGENPEWEITTPAKSKADQAAINSLLFDLKDTRALSFVTFGQKENFGLEQPGKSLTIHQKDGATETLYLGNANLDGKQFFLSRSLDGGVFVLESENVQKLFRTFHDLRNRQLVAVDSDRVRRIILKYSDKTFELERAGKNWTLLQPEKIENLKPFIGNDILWTLNSLQFEKEIVSAGETTTGLDSPALTVSAFDENKNPMAEIKIGAAVEGAQLLWAQTATPSRLAHIKNRFLNEIPSSLDKFRSAKEG